MIECKVSCVSAVSHLDTGMTEKMKTYAYLLGPGG